MKKLFITGGHYTPARAVIDLLGAEYQIFYVGRKFAMEGDTALAIEYQELVDLKKVHYLVITAGRLQRKFFINFGQSVLAFLKIFVGFVQAFWWLLKFRPQVVLSFGGYIAVPVVISAKLLKIPVVTHEQTVTLGLANRLIEKFADKILVSWPQQANSRHIFTGNPLRKEILSLKAKSYGLQAIFVTGGNQGSHVLNQAILEILPTLLKKYKVIHQTGDSKYHDYEALVKLNPNTFKFLNAQEMAENMSRCGLVISRAGANIVSEILYLQKPAIFVPIPWSSRGEQQKNAQLVAGHGQAVVLVQDDNLANNLLLAIGEIEKNYQKFLEAGKVGRTLINPLAAEKIVTEVTALI